MKNRYIFLITVLVATVCTFNNSVAQYVPGGDVDDGLVIWFDAADINTLDLSGSFVNSWANKGSYDISAVQNQPANRPVTDVRTFNGYPVLTFAGSSSPMFLRTPAFEQPIEQTNTIIVVWRSNAPHNGNVLDGIDAFDRHSVGIRTSPSPFIFGWASRFGLQYPTDPGGVHDDLIITNVRFNGESSMIFDNGDYIGVQNPGDLALGGLTIGSNRNENIQQLNGDVAEVLIFDRRITGAERIVIENYLSAKWGIELNHLVRLIQPDGIHKHELVGIGKATSDPEAILSTGFNAGLGLESLGPIRPNYTGLAVAHNGVQNEFVGDDLEFDVAGRWARTWQLGRKGLVNDVNFIFDFDNAGFAELDELVAQVYDRNYVLLMRNEDTGLFENYPVADAVVDEEENTVTFTLSVSQIPENAVITLGYVQELTLESESNGFRLFHPPTLATDLTYEEFFSGIWTQGAIGSSLPSGAPNIFEWSRTNGYQDVLDMNTAFDVEGFGSFNSGAGLMLRVFLEEEIDPSIPEYNPSLLLPGGTVSANRVEPSTNVPLVVNGVGGPGFSEGFYLIGNPYATSININQIVTNNFDDFIYIWNPETANWEFISISDAAGPDSEGLIVAPFQGFFMKANDTGANVIVTNESRTTGGVFIGSNGVNSLQNRMNPIVEERKEELQQRLELSVFSDEHQKGQSTRVMFSHEGQTGPDHRDAYRLIPLANSYVDLFTLNEDRVALGVNHLPDYSDDGVFEIPLDIESTYSGEFTISWKGLETFSSGWAFTLLDHKTGDQLSLDQLDFYTFEVSVGEVADISSRESMVPERIVPEKPESRRSGVNTRFTLIAETGTVENTSDSDVADLPQRVELSQNYPNPFNPTTQIRYALPDADHVRLSVYNVMGQRVATLVNQEQAAGYHTVSFDATRLSSGVYIYRLQANGKILTNKMTLVK